jgi:hypothetical protein
MALDASPSGGEGPRLVGRGGVRAEEVAREEARGGAQGGGDEGHVDVERDEPTAEPLIRIAPVAHAKARLQRDQRPRARVRRERGRAREDQREVLPERVAIKHAGRRLAGEEGPGARARCGRVEQIRRSHGGEEKVVVDHLVIEDGRARIRRRRGRHSIEPYRVFADSLLVRDVAVRSEPIEHRAEPRLDRRGLEGGPEHVQAEQRVAPEIGQETPGAGEEFLSVSEERERVSRPRVVARRARIEEILDRKRREGRLIVEGRDEEPNLAAGSGMEDDVVLFEREGGSFCGLDAEFEAPAVQHCAAQGEGRPWIDRVRERGSFGAEASAHVVTQKPDAGQQGVVDAQVGRARDEMRRDAAQPIGRLDAVERGERREVEGRRQRERPESDDDACIARRKSHEEAGGRSRCREEVRRDRAAAIEVIADGASHDVEAQKLGGGRGRLAQRRCHVPAAICIAAARASGERQERAGQNAEDA